MKVVASLRPGPFVQRFQHHLHIKSIMPTTLLTLHDLRLLLAQEDAENDNLVFHCDIQSCSDSCQMVTDQTECASNDVCSHSDSDITHDEQQNDKS